MTFDDKNNIVEVCIFESFLAKYFLEHPEIFDTLFNKMYSALDAFLKANEGNTDFDRRLFIVLSEVTQSHPTMTDLNAIKESGSVLVWNEFLKFFSEFVMTMPDLNYPPLKTVNPTESLKALTHYSLFSKSPAQAQKLLLEKMRPDYLFSDEHRGCVDVDNAKVKPSFNIGILSEHKNTTIPKPLVNGLTFANYPSKQVYAPKEDSEMADWLREHYLPVISGASGTTGKTVSAISALCFLSSKEYKLLGLLIASATVALGHHSFFEVLRPLSFLTGFIEEQDSLFAFYEQVIPKDIKALDSYKEHMNSDYGVSLIMNLGFVETESEGADFSFGDTDSDESEFSNSR
ncbi:hypothetical protein J2N86_11610 [Legionella lytica]|uniref:Substrate of the Dot/Icm secretion system n=1 Tax=Legionella lytica TaxID=96232 RepID=A0ABY4Y7W3_9GAMM|nr:hypothetical protein [Legionella lytica]USQ13325.1 hypothetical protein J2N86_11610 [Legionella lytica]